MNDLPRFLSTARAADELNVCPATVRQLIYRGTLPVVRVGRIFRIPAAAIEQLATRMATETNR
jgi:excisionase family DNA binding protein